MYTVYVIMIMYIHKWAKLISLGGRYGYKLATCQNTPATSYCFKILWPLLLQDTLFSLGYNWKRILLLTVY